MKSIKNCYPHLLLINYTKPKTTILLLLLLLLLLSLFSRVQLWATP